MKYLWLDVLLAFVIWQMSLYIYDHTTPEYFLSEEVDVFNEDVKNGEVLKNYHIPKESNPNAVSNFIEEMSEISRHTIKMGVEIVGSLLSGFN